MKPRVRPVPVWLQRMRERQRLLLRMGDTRPGGVTYIMPRDYPNHVRPLGDNAFLVNWP